MAAKSILATIALTLVMAAPVQATPAASQSPAASVSITSVRCVAVFEVLSRELPYQMREQSMLMAWKVWQLEAGRVARESRADLGQQLNREITLSTAIAKMNIDQLVDEAIVCTRKAPGLSS